MPISTPSGEPAGAGAMERTRVIFTSSLPVYLPVGFTVTSDRMVTNSEILVNSLGCRIAAIGLCRHLASPGLRPAVGSSPAVESCVRASVTDRYRLVAAPLSVRSPSPLIATGLPRTDEMPNLRLSAASTHHPVNASKRVIRRFSERDAPRARCLHRAGWVRLRQEPARAPGTPAPSPLRSRGLRLNAGRGRAMRSRTAGQTQARLP